MVSLGYNNLWQLGHTISLTYFTAPQEQDNAKVWSGSYTAPLSERWSLQLAGYQSDSDVASIGGSNVLGKGHSYGVSAIYNLPASGVWANSLSVGVDFKDFEEQVTSRQPPGTPDLLADKPHARAYFGVLRLVLGDGAVEAMDDATRQTLVAQALEIDEVVRTAVAENSLSPQSIEAAIRKGLLPLLFGKLGLDRAKEAVEQIVQITRLGLGKAQ